jgi:hypothetical protein
LREGKKGEAAVVAVELTDFSVFYSQDSIANAEAKSMAKFCREMIVQDTDGRLMLDFMGERAREAADSSISTDVVKQARDFVASQYKKHFDDENHKLSSRYFRLSRYINSHAKQWGLE